MKDSGKGEKEGLKLLVDEEKNPARAGALHTLHKLGKSKNKTIYDLIPDEISKEVEDGEGKKVKAIDYDLNNPSAEKKSKIDEMMETRFAELTRELWDLLVVHGYAEEKDDGSYEMIKEVSDLDSESCLLLCKLAGIENARIKYVPQGAGEDEEGLVMDTFRKEGLSGVLAKLGGKTVGIDHHGEESGRDTSAAKHTYEFLIENGLLKKTDYLDDYVKFVTQEDNKEYSELTNTAEKRFRNSWQTLRGLRRYIDPEKIVELFKESREAGGIFDPDTPLSEEFRKGYEYKAKTDDKYDLKNDGKNLLQLGEKIKERIKFTEAAIKKLEEKGFLFDTRGEYGKILIDPGRLNKGGKREKTVKMGHEAAVVFGYDNYLNWDPKNNGFVLYTQKLLDEIRFSQGRNVRGCMWMKPDNEPLQITLEEIFSRLSKKRTKVPKSLKEALAVITLGNSSVDAPEGVDVLRDLAEKDTDAKSEKEMEISGERWDWMQMAIKNYGKSGKDYLKLLKGGKLFEPPKNIREEKEEIEKFLRDGLADYNKDIKDKEKFEEKEIDFMVAKSMEIVFSK
ncbi:MAG: hypothetical protein A2288_00415 [Candidatus Moranbacteria bacterium RIFOXYA12_FULL_44_15]|nr:MAG: hypothetical protein A2288_00415 [Candidatus Moranbacteria bacterium RIFOXYA12_FULL_44_15]